MSLPSGFSRADGLSGRPGTPTPAGAVTIDTAAGTKLAVTEAPVEEHPDSPEIERAEQATITHKFSMSWDEAVTRMTFLGRGLVETDEFGNGTKLLSAKICHKPGGMAELQTVSEAITFDSPPDQFQIVPVELGINIIKHPRYFYAFLGSGIGSATEYKNQMVIRMLQNYFEIPTQAYRDSLTALLYDSLASEGSVGDPIPQWDDDQSEFDGSFVAGTTMAKRAALEIIQKYWRGTENPYIVGYQISWSSFYFRPPYLNPGGYIEDPIFDATPQLPDYFWSPDFPPTSNTIFDFMAAINPQCYSDSGLPNGVPTLSWLRKSDEIDYERTWFKITRSWIGSPVGYWDTELYTSDRRPQTFSDYLELSSPA